MSRYRKWHIGSAESKTWCMYASSLHGNREIPGVTDGGDTIGPVGEGQWPNARYVRAWEVGRRNNIDEVSEQRYSTGICGQPPAEFAEKSPSAKGN